MKIIAYVALTILVVWGITVWYNVMIPSNYWQTAPFYQTLFMVALLIGGIIGAVKLYRLIARTDFKNLLVLLPIGIAIVGISSCTYVKSNQIVVYSKDCGSTWTQVKAGERVPTGTGNPCYVQETMPGYEMQGDMLYFVLFKDQVKVQMAVTYSYLIEDPLLFMKFAKKLGRTNADADDAQEDNARFEGAENRVIETRIKTVTSDEFPQQDVVSHDMNALELEYMELINKSLKERGVRLTVFEMVPNFQQQTQLAIDAANADRIYQAKGMQEFGRQVTLARAGATQIIINQPGQNKDNGDGNNDDK